MTDQKIRCFIAVQLPSEVQNQISDYINKLKKCSTDVRWVQAANIHLTLKFLGEIDSSRIDLVKQSLYPISNKFSSFHLNISGSGCFPGKNRPRVFWLGMDQGEENSLFSSHQWIENQLADINFEREKRRFSPHLTLGRVRSRESVDFSDLFTFLEQNPFTPKTFSVECIYFMQSFLKPTGAEYQIIEKYPLK